MTEDDASEPSKSEPMGAEPLPSNPGPRPGIDPKTGFSLSGPLAMVRVGRGDRGAFQDIYDAYKQDIHAFLVRMVFDAGTAEDLLQETFLRVYREAARYDPCRPLEPWLFRIARNLAVDHLRSRKRKPLAGLTGPEAPALEAEDPAPGPDACAVAREREVLLRKGLEKLRPSQREVFVLVDLEGLKYEEVANLMSISVKAVGARLRKARRRFLTWAKPHEMRLFGESEEPETS